MSRTHLSRLFAVAIVVLTLAATVLPATDAYAVDDVTPARVGGAERTATAANVALRAFPAGTDQAIITTSFTAQDALISASLAGATDAAMLLVNPNQVPEATAAALQELGVQTITLVGNEASISAAVQEELAVDYDVVRINGATPYAIAAAVADQTVEVAGTMQINGLRTVLLANGETFPDALSGSAAAYAGPLPVLYTEPAQLREEVSTFLDARDIQQVIILGGTLAVSDEVQTALENRGRKVVRLGGQTRVETSTVIAAWTEEELSFATDTIILARGDDFPDALTAGQLGGTLRVPLVLAATPTVLPQPAAQYFADRCETIEVVQAVGGEKAISTAVLETAEDAAETCTISEPSTPPPGSEGPADFAMDPLEIQTDIFKVDTVAATDLDGVETLDAALLPCNIVTVNDDGSAIFTDSDDDGFADGYGDTLTGTSLITGINNANVDDARVVPQNAAEDGRLGVQVSAYEADCAIVAVHQAQPASASGLPVDESGQPTIPYGVSTVRFGTPPENPGTDSHVFNVEPTEAITGALGLSEQFTVTGRVDGDPLTIPLDIVLFPCDQNDVLGAGDDTFDDADNDGGADGFADTETGAISITEVNGQSVSPTKIESASPVDGEIHFAVNSDAVDCATIVVVDGNGNGKFDVTAEGLPEEPYGVAQISYQ